MKQQIEICGERFDVIKTYTDERGNNFVEYRDPLMRKTIWTRLGVTTKTRLMKNGWVRHDKEIINLWNPISWLIIILSFLATFFLYGVEGIKDFHPFRPIIDHSDWFKKDEVKMLTTNE